jgi:two-component system, sensor histidine kinase and response regulator
MEDSASALAAIEIESFDLIFLDWQMPGMDGIELTHRIRAMALAQQPRIVMLTGFGREDVLRSARQSGVDRVLMKPLNPQTLLDEALLVARQIAPPPTRVPEVASEPLVQASFCGARVLLVEDNEINQEVALGLLAAAGVITEVVGNGRLAVERIQSVQFDLVLMDLQMPVLDGLAATAEIRAMPRFAQLPIVAMTANAMAGDRERCLAAGMSDYISKPVEPEELQRVLSRWLPKINRLAGPPPLMPVASLPVTSLPVGLLAPLTGVDLAGGLRRVLGKEAVYRDLLRRFSATHQGWNADVRAALQREDWDSAERAAHTLRGTAGNLGAQDISQAAATLEGLLRARAARAGIDVQLTLTTRLLAQLFTQLAAALPPLAERPVTGTVDWPTIHRLCARLQELLTEADTQASELVTEHAGALQAAFPLYAAELERSTDQFDYERALSVLRQALETTTECRGE